MKIPGSSLIIAVKPSAPTGEITKYPAITPKKAMEALRRQVVLASAAMRWLATKCEVPGIIETMR